MSEDTSTSQLAVIVRDGITPRLTLVFGGVAEREYKIYWCHKHVRMYKQRVWMIVILYLILLSGMLDAIQPSQVPLLIYTYGSISLAFVFDLSMSMVKRFEAYFEIYLGIGSFFSMAAAVSATYMLQGQASNALFYAGMMFPIIVIFCYLGLSFYYAASAVLGGVSLGLLLVYTLGYTIDWGLFYRIVPATVILGMIISHSYDYIDRESYLKTHQLEDAQAISEQKNILLDDLAKHDGLTGLANRRYMDERLKVEWNHALRGKPLSVFMIDIDFFKNFNDTLGHQAGDDCIARVAGCIQELAKRAGEFAVRYGGEEFLVVYPYDDEKQLCTLANLINEKVRLLDIQHPSSSVSDLITVSIGVATYSPKLTHNLMALIAHADTALYLAKESGRNGYVVYRETL